MGCVLQGEMSESFVKECALRVLFQGRGQHASEGDNDSSSAVCRSGPIKQADLR